MHKTLLILAATLVISPAAWAQPTAYLTDGSGNRVMSRSEWLEDNREDVFSSKRERMRNHWDRPEGIALDEKPVPPAATPKIYHVPPAPVMETTKKPEKAVVKKATKKIEKKKAQKAKAAAQKAKKQELKKKAMKAKAKKAVKKAAKKPAAKHAP